MYINYIFKLYAHTHTAASDQQPPALIIEGFGTLARFTRIFLRLNWLLPYGEGKI